MPELPEVERARALIERAALRRRIVAVEDGDTFVCRPHGPGEISDALVGRELTAAHRRGKAMWCDTSADGPALGLHLGMAGRIVVDAAEDGDSATRSEAGDPTTPSASGARPLNQNGRPARWDRFVLHFADGGRLVLRDKRRLGRVRLEPDLDRIGPDAATVSRAAFRSRVGRGTAPLKARIMDQSVLAGVGNLLADETLWRARLSPLRPAGELDAGELDRLRRELRAAVRSAIRKGGVHTGALIRHRRRGGHCPRCGTGLQRATVGGRTTWWCPAEQA